MPQGVDDVAKVDPGHHVVNAIGCRLQGSGTVLSVPWDSSHSVIVTFVLFKHSSIFCFSALSLSEDPNAFSTNSIIA